MNLSQPLSAALRPLTQPPSNGEKHRKVLSGIIITLASLIGAVAFVAPFCWPQIAQNTASLGPQGNAQIFLVAILALSLGALVFEAQGQAMNAKVIALLGVLIAINSALRFAENALPGPGGFTPVFMLIILTGAVFGARIGFLMGALSMLASAIFTGGVGPWLPYQMFTAGWMGLSASILDFRFAIFDSPQSKIQNRKSKIQFASLLIFSAVWGFLYGAIMNLWSWPFQAGDPAQSWQAGLSVLDGVKRYAVFYVVTSLWWDAFAAIGNVMLVALFGLPTLKALQRFKGKFLFEIRD